MTSGSSARPVSSARWARSSWSRSCSSAQQAEQTGPPQQDQALQTGGGGIKGQIIGPAQAHPLLQLHNFLFAKFPDGHSTSPLSATSLCGPGRVHAKSGGKAPPGCGILELFPNNSE